MGHLSALIGRYQITLCVFPPMATTSGRAVAVEVAPAQVLRGDGRVQHGAIPGLAVEVIGRDPCVLAAVAGEDLVVAVAVHVGDPEGVAVVEGVVQDGRRAEME